MSHSVEDQVLLCDVDIYLVNPSFCEGLDTVVAVCQNADGGGDVVA